jgi:hypothetical protein
MNAPYLLILVEKPQQLDDRGQPNPLWLQWLGFVSARAKIGKTEALNKRLPETLLLLPLPTTLRTASEFLTSNTVRSLPHTLLYLEAPPVICE